MSLVGGAIGTALAGAELIEQRGGAMLRKSLNWPGERIKALVGGGGAPGELPRGSLTAVSGRGS